MTLGSYKTKSLIVFIIVLYIIIDSSVPPIEKQLRGQPELLEKVIKIIDLLSTPFIITFILLLIDRFGWKFKVFSWLVDVPNIIGRYEGHFTSSDWSGEFKCAMEIAQTASKTRITIFYYNPNENKNMLLYSILENAKRGENSINVKFIYNNDFDSFPSRDIEPSGAIFISIKKTTKAVEGYYFNRRPHIGDISLEYKSKRLLRRL